MAAEDIGLGNPDAIVQLRALRQSWDEEQKRPDGGEARLFLVQAIMVLCRSRKSRDVDNQLIYHFCEHALLRSSTYRDVPDYAIDRHTERGRSMKRNWGHFWQIGSKLEPEVSFAGDDRLYSSQALRERAMDALSKHALPPDPKKMKGKLPSTQAGENPNGLFA